jgi:hypothetical protein
MRPEQRGHRCDALEVAIDEERRPKTCGGRAVMRGQASWSPIIATTRSGALVGLTGVFSQCRRRTASTRTCCPRSPTARTRWLPRLGFQGKRAAGGSDATLCRTTRPSSLPNGLLKWIKRPEKLPTCPADCTSSPFNFTSCRADATSRRVRWFDNSSRGGECFVIATDRPFQRTSSSARRTSCLFRRTNGPSNTRTCSLYSKDGWSY